MNCIKLERISGVTINRDDEGDPDLGRGLSLLLLPASSWAFVLTASSLLPELIGNLSFANNSVPVVTLPPRLSSSLAYAFSPLVWGTLRTINGVFRTI